MAAHIEKRIIDIQINARKARKGLNEITKSLKKTETNVNKLKNAFKTLRSAMGALGLTVAALGFGRAIKESLAFVASISDVSERIGFTTDSLQELRFAASLVGVDIRQVDIALQRFSRRVGNAANGSGELSAVFKEQGIELRDVNGEVKTSEVLLNEFADAVQNASSSSEQLALTVKAFDSEGGTLVNILRDGSKGLDEFGQRAQAAGVVIDKDLVQQAAKLDESFGIAITQLTKLFRVFVVKAVGALTILPKVFKVVNGIIVKEIAQFINTIKVHVENLVGAFKIIAAFITNIFDSASRTQAVNKAMLDTENNVRRLNSQTRLLIDAVNDDTAAYFAQQAALETTTKENVKKNKVLAVATKQYTALSNSITKSNDDLRNQQTTIGKTGIELVELNAELKRNQRAQAIAKLVNADPAQIATLKGLADAERDLTIKNFGLKKSVDDVTKAEQERVAVQEKGEALQKQQATNFATSKQRINAAIGAMKNQVTLLGATDEVVQQNAASRKKLNEQLRIQSEFEAGKLTQDNARELLNFTEQQEAATNATQAQTRAFVEQQKKVDDLKQTFNNFTKQSSDAITDFVTKGKADFSSLIDSFVKDLIRLQIQQQLTSALSGTKAGFVNLFASLFSGGTSPAAAGSPTPSTGGVLDTPTIFKAAKGATLAGEAGPEAILPLTRTRGGNLGVQTSGGGGANVTVNVVNSADGTTATTQERRGANGQKIIDVMIQSAVNKGFTSGVFDKSLGGTFGISRRGRS